MSEIDTKNRRYTFENFVLASTQCSCVCHKFIGMLGRVDGVDWFFF